MIQSILLSFLVMYSTLTFAGSDPLYVNSIVIEQMVGSSPAITKALSGIRKVSVRLESERKYFAESHYRYQVKPATYDEATERQVGEIHISPQTPNQRICGIGTPPPRGIVMIGTLTSEPEYTSANFELPVGKYDIYVNGLLNTQIEINQIGEFSVKKNNLKLAKGLKAAKLKQKEISFAFSTDKGAFSGIEKDNQAAQCKVTFDLANLKNNRQIGVKIWFEKSKKISGDGFTTILDSNFSHAEDLKLDYQRICTEYDRTLNREKFGAEKVVKSWVQLETPYRGRISLNHYFSAYEDMAGLFLKNEFDKPFSVQVSYQNGHSRSCSIENQPLLVVK